MFKTKTLAIAAFTGLCLFFYALSINYNNTVFEIINEILKPIILVGISLVCVDIVSFLVVDVLLTKKGRKHRSQLLRSVVGTLLYIPFIFLIFRLLGQDLTALAATSTLFGAIVGFALQTPLGNFLSGIALRVHQPFTLGDYVQIGGEFIGSVTDLDWRTTTLRMDSGAMLHIPNGTVENSPVQVIPAGKPGYCAVEFTAPSQVSPHQVEGIVLKAVQHHLNPNINSDQPLYVRMANYGTEEITYNLYYVPHQHELVETHTNPLLRCRLWYALGRAGLRQAPSSLATDVDQWIGQIEFFREFSVEARHRLQEASQILLFDRDEGIDQTYFPNRSLLLVIRGTLLAKQQLLTHTDTDFSVRRLSHRPKQQQSHPMAISPEELTRISHQLAEYLGPAAFSVVPDAAVQASSSFALYKTLAPTIADPNDRQEFLQYQPNSPTELFQNGDLLGEMTLFLGEPLPEVEMSTLEETEILAIPPAAVQAALAHDGYALEALSQQVAHYYDLYLRDTLQAIRQPLSTHNLAETIYTSFSKAIKESTLRIQGIS